MPPQSITGLTVFLVTACFCPILPTSRSPMNKSLRTAVTATTCLLLAACASSHQTPNGGQSHFASFGMNKVHYVIEGQGSHTIMLVHCWGSNCQAWHTTDAPSAEFSGSLVQSSYFGRGQWAPASRWELTVGERADARAHKAEDGVSDLAWGATECGLGDRRVAPPGRERETLSS